MSKPCGIIVFGANGCGKTTLGRELARILNFKHIDHEDYAFEKSEIPYTISRSDEECIKLMLADIEKYDSFILSAVIGDFGDAIPRYYKLAMLVEAPLDIRLKRIEQRGVDNFGNRVREGGDMYGNQQKFINYVKARPMSRIERWAETLICPFMRIDGTEDWRVSAAKVAKRVIEITEGMRKC